MRLSRGKLNSLTIPIAWVKTGKDYVSWHLMGFYGNPRLLRRAEEDTEKKGSRITRPSKMAPANLG